jgi:hypothetical protein
MNLYGKSQEVHTYGGFIKGILRGVRCTKSLRVLFLHRRSPSWTTLVLYSRAVFMFNEPAFRVSIHVWVLVCVFGGGGGIIVVKKKKREGGRLGLLKIGLLGHKNL